MPFLEHPGIDTITFPSFVCVERCRSGQNRISRSAAKSKFVIGTWHLPRANVSIQASTKSRSHHVPMSNDVGLVQIGPAVRLKIVILLKHVPRAIRVMKHIAIDQITLWSSVRSEHQHEQNFTKVARLRNQPIPIFEKSSDFVHFIFKRALFRFSHFFLP